MKYTTKPRNFVAKNMTTSGAGAHKDKKKAAKQGETKHKKKEVVETTDRKLALMLELSLMEAKISELKQSTKDSYKEKATAQVKELEPHAKKGEYKDIAQRAIDRRKKGLKRVEEVTGDPKFDKMLKGVTGKKAVAKQRKADSQQQARHAIDSMFGGGNPADKLSIRKKGVAEVASAAAVRGAIAISKRESGKYTKDGKRKKNEGWTHDSLAAELFETPSYENRLREMLEGKIEFMEGGTEERVTMASKKPGSHQHLNDSDQGNIDDMGLASVHPSEKGDEDEYGMEGEYLRNELHTIMRVCKHLEHALDDDEDLPTWVIDKMSQAKGMIVSVMDYLISEKEETLDKKSGKEDHMMK